VIKKVRNYGRGRTDRSGSKPRSCKKYELTLFYRKTKPDISLKLKTVQADLSDEKQIKGIFDGLDAIVHLAAAAHTQSPWTKYSITIS